MIVASDKQYISQKMEKNAWTLGLSEYMARSLWRNKYDEHAIEVAQNMALMTVAILGSSSAVAKSK
jgi:hypothetical protein